MSIHYGISALLVVVDLALYTAAYYHFRTKLGLLRFRLILALHGLPGDLRRDLYIRYKSHGPHPVGLLSLLRSLL